MGCYYINFTTQSRAVCSSLNYNNTSWYENPEISNCIKYWTCTAPNFFILVYIVQYAALSRVHFNNPCFESVFFSHFCCQTFLKFILIKLNFFCLVLSIYMDVKFSILYDFLHFISYFLLILTLSVNIFINYKQIRKYRRKSSWEFLFFFFLLFAFVPRFYQSIFSYVCHQSQSNLFEVVYTSLQLLITILILLFQICCSSLRTNWAVDVERSQGISIHEPCPEKFASVPSKWTFSWLSPTIYKAFKGQLVSSDQVFSVREREAVARNYDRFKSELKHSFFIYRKSSKTWIFCRTIFLIYLTRFINSWMLLLLQAVLVYLYPSVFNFILTFLSLDNGVFWLGYILPFGFLFTNNLSVIPFYYGTYKLFTVCTSIRSALTAAIYRKCLQLTSSSRSLYTKGQLMNLLISDIENIVLSINTLHLLPISIIKFSIASYILAKEISIVALVPLGYLTIVFLVLSIVYIFCIRAERKQLKLMDKRIFLVENFISNQKLMKLYSWEKYFEKIISNVRFEEARQDFFANSIYCGMNITSYSLTSSLFVCGILPYVYLISNSNYVLTSAKVFIVLTTAGLFTEPLISVLSFFYQIGIAYISINRLMDFLSLDQNLHNGNQTINFTDQNMDPDTVILFKNCTIQWTKDLNPVLQSINLSIPSGKLIAIVGPLSSGKTSFLLSCLREPSVINGLLNVSGSIAYVSQQIWVHHQTIRNNIIFAGVVNEIWYKKVIELCGVQDQLSRYPDGDNTIISEEDSSAFTCGFLHLVNLARAVYQCNDIYLLDDPLIAVESSIADRVFDAVIGPNGLLKDSTRLVVTSDFKHLNQFDSVLVINKSDKSINLLTTGYSIEKWVSENFQDADSSNQECSRHLSHFIASKKENQVSGSREEPITLSSLNLHDNLDITTIDHSRNDVHFGKTSSSNFKKSSRHQKLAAGSVINSSDRAYLLQNQELETLDDHNFQTRVDFAFNQQQLNRTLNISPPLSIANIRDVLSASTLNDSEEDISHSEKISIRKYLRYIRYRNIPILLFILLLYVGVLVAINLSSFSLKMLSEDKNFINYSSQLSNPNLNPIFRKDILKLFRSVCAHYLITYFSCVLIIIVGISLHFSIYNYSTFLVSIKLHSQVFKSLLLKISFSKYNVINRLSSDFQAVDKHLHANFHGIIACALSFLSLSILFLVSLKQVYIGILFLSIILAATLPVVKLYLPCCRQAQRLYYMTQTSIISTFSETACSTLSIRLLQTFSRRVQFASVFDRLINENAACLYLLYTAKCWFLVRIEGICSFMIFLVSMLVIYTRKDLSIGNAGLLITSTKLISDALIGFISNIPSLFSNLVSLERIEECIQNTSEEIHNLDNQIAENFKLIERPVVVEIQNLNLNAEGIDLFCEFSARFGGIDSRVTAITGASPSQKIHLANQFIKSIQCSSTNSSGSIFIANYDIAHLTKENLTNLVGFLPEESSLFVSLPLKLNLDPSGTLSDDNLYEVLEILGLTSRFESQLSLNTILTDDLKFDDRKLICLARLVILQKLRSGGSFPFVIFDEPIQGLSLTASSRFLDLILSNHGLFSKSTILILTNKLEMFDKYITHIYRISC